MVSWSRVQRRGAWYFLIPYKNGFADGMVARTHRRKLAYDSHSTCQFVLKSSFIHLAWDVSKCHYLPLHFWYLLQPVFTDNFDYPTSDQLYLGWKKKTNEPGSFTLFSLQLLLTFTAVNAFSSKYVGFLALTAHTLRSGYRRHIRWPRRGKAKTGYLQIMV